MKQHVFDFLWWVVLPVEVSTLLRYFVAFRYISCAKFRDSVCVMKNSSLEIRPSKMRPLLYL